MPEVTPAHTQHFDHSYWVSYPDHYPREQDPNYKDFHAFHVKNSPGARCAYAIHGDLPGDAEPVRQDAAPHRLIGPAEERVGCDVTHPIELHHAHVEFALANEVDLALLEKDYPGVSNPDEVGAWVETGANFIWYCSLHHRGLGGAHSASASDFEAERYVLGLIKASP